MISPTTSHDQITEKLGGGMGVAYETKETLLGRDVALKTLPQKFAENEQALEKIIN